MPKYRVRYWDYYNSRKAVIEGRVKTSDLTITVTPATGKSKRILRRFVKSKQLIGHDQHRSLPLNKTPTAVKIRLWRRGGRHYIVVKGARGWKQLAEFKTKEIATAILCDMIMADGLPWRGRLE